MALAAGKIASYVLVDWLHLGVHQTIRIFDFQQYVGANCCYWRWILSGNECVLFGACIGNRYFVPLLPGRQREK